MADEYIGVASTDGMSTITLGKLNTWFEIPDLSPLWDLADEFAVDADLPDSDALVPYARPRTGVDVSLGFNLRGDLTRANSALGTLTAARTQLWDHRQYLKANVCGRSAAATGTRTITLHLPDGSTATIAAHVGRRLYLVGSSPVELEGTLRLSIPAGEL